MRVKLSPKKTMPCHRKEALRLRPCLLPHTRECAGRSVNSAGSPDGTWRGGEKGRLGRNGPLPSVHQGFPGLTAWVRACLGWVPLGGSGRYLLHVLLEDAELQPLVEPHLAVLPDALEPPLVVQHLVHHVQHLVHCLGVVGGGREGLSVPRAQGTLQHIQQSFAILADLQEGEVRSREPGSGRAQGGRESWQGELAPGIRR